MRTSTMNGKNPCSYLSDGANALQIDGVESILSDLQKIDRVIKGY